MNELKQYATDHSSSEEITADEEYENPHISSDPPTFDSLGNLETEEFLKEFANEVLSNDNNNQCLKSSLTTTIDTSLINRNEYTEREINDNDNSKKRVERSNYSSNYSKSSSRYHPYRFSEK